MCVLFRRTKARVLQADCSSLHLRVFRRLRKTLVITPRLFHRPVMISLALRLGLVAPISY
jgi:hypothetical protein